MAMFSVCRRGMAGRQRWCRGGSVGRHAGGTDDDDVWSLSARYTKMSVEVSWQKVDDTAVVLVRIGFPPIGVTHNTGLRRQSMHQQQ